MTGNIRNFLFRILGFQSGELPTRYLGTPLALTAPEDAQLATNS